MKLDGVYRQDVVITQTSLSLFDTRLSEKFVHILQKNYNICGLTQFKVT